MAIYSGTIVWRITLFIKLSNHIFGFWGLIKNITTVVKQPYSPHDILIIITKVEQRNNQLPILSKSKLVIRSCMRNDFSPIVTIGPR